MPCFAHSTRAGLTAWLALAISAYPGIKSAQARVLTIEPPSQAVDCDEPFETAANALEPGDELVLLPGEYSQRCVRQISVRGTPARPIIIRASEPGSAIVTRPAETPATQNNIEFIDCTWLVIRGLVFRGGSSGVRFVGGERITFEHNVISHTGNNALRANTGDTSFFVIRGNRIHHTGRDARDAEGEGMYLGCHDGSCVAHDHLVENNWLHDLGGGGAGGNDGIELKPGSYGNIVRGNRIDAGSSRFPCITAYGGGPAPNRVKANVLSNCRPGIFAVADARIMANTVLSAGSALISEPHDDQPRIRRLAIEHNTLVGDASCSLFDWRRATAVRLAGNAFQCNGATPDVRTRVAPGVSAATANTVSYRGGEGLDVRADDAGPLTAVWISRRGL